DPGGLDIEGQAQPRQQLATVARRRREDEAARGHPGIVHRWLARPPSPYTAAMAAPRPLDPKRLDVAAFAALGGELSGEIAAAAMPRLASATLPPEDGSPRPDVQWRGTGERL